MLDISLFLLGLNVSDFTNDPGGLPAGANGFVDFVNLTYFFVGSTSPIEDVLVEDFDNYQPFNIADVVDGIGYAPTASGGPKFTGDVSPLLLAGATVVIEFSLASADKFLEYYHVRLPDFDNEYRTQIEHTNAGGNFTNNIPSGNISWGNIGGGTHKAAITHAENHVALSIDGGVADSDTSTWGWLPTDVYISLRAHVTDAEAPGVIKSIVVYPVKQPADLPALSTL